MPTFISFFIEPNYNGYVMVCTPSNNETVIPAEARSGCTKSEPSVTCFPMKSGRAAPGPRATGLSKSCTVEQTAGNKNEH